MGERTGTKKKALFLQWRPLVLGSVDGLISGIAFTSGSILNGVERRNYIALGLGIIISESFSMSVSEFLSSLEEGEYSQGICNALACGSGFFLSSLAPFLAVLIFFSSERWIRFLSLCFVGAGLILLFSKVRSLAFSFSFPVSFLQTSVVVGVAFGIAIGTNLIALSFEE